MRQLSRNSKGQFEPTHGLYKTGIYMAWHNIKERCYTPSCKSYMAYGNKGVTLYDKWHDVKVFYDYCIDNGWFEGCHIARYNDVGSYIPGNIKFITPYENRREAGVRHGRNIKCIETGQCYESIKDAARWIESLNRYTGTLKTITENIRSKGLKGSTSYGYTWEVVK